MSEVYENRSMRSGDLEPSQYSRVNSLTLTCDLDDGMTDEGHAYTLPSASRRGIYKVAGRHERVIASLLLRRHFIMSLIFSPYPKSKKQGENKGYDWFDFSNMRFQ